MASAGAKSSKNSRLYLLSAIMLLWCAAICVRLVDLQVFNYGKFVKQAGHQQQRAIPLAAKRGVIYDRAGHELAMSVMVDSAFAVPTEVKDLPTAVALITRITGEDYNVVLADCRAHKTFCWVARKADDETIERINSLKLQGIHFQKEPKRFYPGARSRRASPGFGRHGRLRPERHRARIRRTTRRTSRKNVHLR